MTPSRAGGVLSRPRISTILSDSLYRNSGYLLLNMAVSTLGSAGFIFLCTHLYPLRTVGYATALLSAVGLATAVSSLGMGRTAVRFLPGSDAKDRDVATMSAVVLVGSLVAGLVLIALFRPLGISRSTLTLDVIFVGTTVAMALKTQFDSVFISARRASGALQENIGFTFGKLVTVVLLVFLGESGIVASQLVGAVLAVLICATLVHHRLGISLAARPSLRRIRCHWRFAFGSYTSDVIGGLPSSLLPLVVVSRFGPSKGALWYAAIQLVNFIITITSVINQAMFAEMASATDGKAIRHIIRRALIVMYLLVAPICLVVFVFARTTLSIFGGDYVAASHVLRLMVIFALIGVLNYVSGSILSLEKRVGYLTVVNVVNALVVVLYGAFVASNLSGIAVGWMLGEVVNVVLFVAGAAYFYRRSTIFGKNEMVSL